MVFVERALIMKLVSKCFFEGASRRCKRLGIVVASLPAAMLCLSASAAEPTLTIGLVDTFSPDFYINSYSPTIDHLKAAMPGYRFRIVELDYRQVDTDIDSLRPDFLVTSASLYAELMGTAGTHQIATREPKTSKSPAQTVASTFIVKASNPARTLNDLKGKRIAVSDKSSFDGWLIAQGELARQELDPESHFTEVIETDYAVPDVATLVRIGAADAGVLSTCEYESLLKTGLIKVGEFHILAERPKDGGCVRSTDRYPDVVFSSLPWVNAETVREVTVAILSMPSDKLEFHWTVCNDFVPTYELLRTLSIGPFAVSNDLTMAALWARWKTEILLGLLLMAAVAFHIVTINLLVRKRTEQLSEAIAETERFFVAAQQAREALLTIERTNIVAQLSSMFAHEIKQPIMNISLYAGAIRLLLDRLGISAPAKAQVSEILDSLGEEVERSVKIVDHVRSYAKKRARNLVPVNLAETAVDATKTVEERSLQIENRLPDGLWVKADPFEMLFILSNFIRNAAAAIKGEPTGRIVLEAADLGTQWQVSVVDNGPAMSDEVFAQLGKAGASNKPDGLGFGLAIAAGIAEANGGHIKFERILPHGLCAKLILTKSDEDSRKKSPIAHNGDIDTNDKS